MIEEIEEAAWAQFNGTLPPEAAKRVASALTLWLTQKARLLPIPDLAEKLTQFSVRITKLSERLSLEFSRGNVTIHAGGPEHDTLVALDRGCGWFDGHPNVAQEVVKAVFNTQ